MKINKTSKKLIKPHTPTPHHLKNYNISFIDSYMVPMNFAVILFYHQSKPHQLQESLSKTLVKFYPLSGRYINNDRMIDCNDHGVEFIEAEALDIQLTPLMASSNLDHLNPLLPDHYFRPNEAGDPLMSIQATHFRQGGGLAIAISVYHKVFDAASLAAFVASWANATNFDGKKVELPSPSFHLPSLLPHREHDFGVSSGLVRPQEKKVVKRFSFERSGVENLQFRTRPGRRVSGARAVCSCIAKVLIRTDRAVRGRSRDLVILQAVDMRGRTAAPQPENSCGNMVITAISRRVTAEEGEGIGMGEMVEVMGGSIRKGIGDHAGIFCGDGRDLMIKNLGSVIREMMDVETNVVVFTDWSKFGYYEADFGWGKPAWTSTGRQRPYRNTVVIMSGGEGGGIEAWVHLSQDEMRCFEQDEEIKLYTRSF